MYETSSKIYIVISSCKQNSFSHKNISKEVCIHTFSLKNHKKKAYEEKHCDCDCSLCLGFPLNLCFPDLQSNLATRQVEHVHYYLPLQSFTATDRQFGFVRWLSELDITLQCLDENTLCVFVKANDKIESKGDKL